MNYFAVILDWFPAEPVYHAFDNDRLNEEVDVGLSVSFTVCGRVVSEYDREAERLREPGDWVPLRHARKFARPCRLCFRASPEART